MFKLKSIQANVAPLSIRISIVLASILFIAPSISFAQTFAGLKAGVNASHIKYENEVYNEYFECKPQPGYTIGGVFLIENKEQFGLYTELLYTVKGKSIVSDANNYETNIASYQFLDFPIMFRMKFKHKYFKWFLGAGPEISYWLGGKGSFNVYQPDRNNFVDYDYKLNFGEPKTSIDYMNVSEANRLQIGLAVGGGFIWELDDANFISLDIRYSMGHTYLGAYESASLPLIGLVDNFEYTVSTLSVSAVYYFDIMEKLRLSKNKYRKRN